MNWSSISRAADLLSLVTSTMAIIGIGGLLAVFRSNPSLILVVGSGLRFLIALAILPLAFVGWQYFFVALVLAFGADWHGTYWSSEHATSYAIAYAVSLSITLPIVVAGFLAITIWSTSPLTTLSRSFFPSRKSR